MEGVCEKCKKYVFDLTTHHVIPQRFKKPRNGDPLLMLCRNHHTLIEKLIPQRLRLSNKEYIRLANKFIEGVYDDEVRFNNRRQWVIFYAFSKQEHHMRYVNLGRRNRNKRAAYQFR